MISPLAFVDPAAKLGKNVTVQPLHISKAMWRLEMIVLSCPVRVFSTVHAWGKGTKCIMAPYSVPSRRISLYGREESADHRRPERHSRNVVVSRATHEGDATRIGNENFLMDGVHLAMMCR